MSVYLFFFDKINRIQVLKTHELLLRVLVGLARHLESSGCLLHTFLKVFIFGRVNPQPQTDSFDDSTYN